MEKETEAPKECAARIGGRDCKRPRSEGKMFCNIHTHASNRIYLASTVTNEQLDFMIAADRRFYD